MTKSTKAVFAKKMLMAGCGQTVIFRLRGYLEEVTLTNTKVLLLYGEFQKKL